ncbi:Hypothetical Protein FCC1311_072092 [Hondaea fermentalgiana]|uniref:Uncharacterized protein n=1 Tax=Hondaea fermentalgiana TaxID=2315210 RepID=A0A2R5GMM8_9STRA|nr:Hypothetical Protein FCC1311_072092 [Hondaea fermentalgiana]|eukprot:GBG30988.1 Hypothetical Protein FCC1311_072092 [Hondaea fermentalgiana]
MKRSLTNDILMAFRTSNSPSASPSRPSAIPSSQTKTDDAKISEKRRRVISYDGQTQATEALLAGVTSNAWGRGSAPEAPWNSKEFFSMLRVQPGPVQDQLSKPLDSLRAKLGESEMPYAEKQAVAKFATNAIWTMTEAAEKLRAREMIPEGANTLEMEAELQNSKLSPMQLINIHSKICRESIRALAAANRASEEAQMLARTCEERMTEVKNEVGKLIVVRRADLTARENALKEAADALAQQDAKVAGALQKATRDKSVNNTNAISLCLDVVMDPTPEVAPLLSERRRLRQAHDRASAFLGNTRKSARVHEHLLIVVKSALTALEGGMRLSLESGSNHRSTVARSAAQTVIKQIPQLAKSLADFITFQKERNETAARRIVTKREELDEHLRLYGDEAPSELKEIKRRLAEFEGIQARSEENLRNVAQAQRELWMEGLKRVGLADAENAKGQDDGEAKMQQQQQQFFVSTSSSDAPLRAVLPASVIIRLQRCLVELGTALASFEGVESIKTVVREILERSYDFCPRRAPRTPSVVAAPAPSSFEIVEEKEETSQDTRGFSSISSMPKDTPRSKGVAMVPAQPLLSGDAPRYPQLEDLALVQAARPQSQVFPSRSFLDRVTVAAGFAEDDEDEDEAEDADGGGGCLLM